MKSEDFTAESISDTAVFTKKRHRASRTISSVFVLQSAVTAHNLPQDCGGQRPGQTEATVASQKQGATVPPQMADAGESSSPANAGVLCRAVGEEGEFDFQKNTLFTKWFRITYLILQLLNHLDLDPALGCAFVVQTVVVAYVSK